jgi:hypothetical protein
MEKQDVLNEEMKVETIGALENIWGLASVCKVPPTAKELDPWQNGSHKKLAALKDG